MSTAVKHKHVESSLADHISTNIVEFTTIFYGEEIDVAALTEWAEVYITQINGKKRRINNLYQATSSIKFEFFYTGESNHYRANEMYKIARNLLRHSTIDITDFSGPTVVGGIRIGNPKQQQNDRRIGGRHHNAIPSITAIFPFTIQET